MPQTHVQKQHSASQLEVLCLDGHPKLTALTPALCALPALRELHLRCESIRAYPMRR